MLSSTNIMVTAVVVFIYRHQISSSSLGSLRPLVSRGWAKAPECRLQISLPCAVLCQIGLLKYLSRSCFHRLAGLPCRLFLSYGLQVVTREVHRSSLRRLICPGQDHFILLTFLVISMTFVLSFTQMFVFLSLYVMLSMHRAYFFPFWSVRPRVSSALVLTNGCFHCRRILATLFKRGEWEITTVRLISVSFVQQIIDVSATGLTMMDGWNKYLQELVESGTVERAVIIRPDGTSQAKTDSWLVDLPEINNIWVSKNSCWPRIGITLLVDPILSGADPAFG